MDARSLLLPLSILLGCSLLAAVLIFTRQPAPPPAAPLPVAPSPAPAPPPDPEAPSGPPVAGSALELPPVSPTVRERGQENAARGLAALRPALIAACWSPLPEGERPASVRLIYNLSFSPEGRLVAWGLSQPRGVEVPRLVTCLQEQVLDVLTIPAPGVPLVVEVPFAMP